MIRGISKSNKYLELIDNHKLINMIHLNQFKGIASRLFFFCYLTFISFSSIACDTTPVMEGVNTTDVGGGFFTVDVQVCLGDGSEDGFDISMDCGLNITATNVVSLDNSGRVATSSIAGGVLTYSWAGFPSTWWEPDPGTNPCFNFTITVDGDPLGCSFSVSGVNDGCSNNTSGGVWTESINGPCVADLSMTAPDSRIGTTTGAGDNCDFRPSEEQLIEVIIPCSDTWSFSLCGASWDTYMYLSDNCCSGIITSNDDASGICSPQSELSQFLTAGTYYVTVEAWSSSITGSYTLDVSSASPCANCSYNIDAGDDDTICDGGSYTLQAASFGGILNTQWTSSGDGLFDDPTLLDATYTPGASDVISGSVVLTVTSDDPVGSCAAVVDGMALTISPVSDASITNPGPLCENGAVLNLTAADIGGTWSGIGITDSANGTFDPTVSGSGSWDIAYTISGFCGGTDTVSMLVDLLKDATIVPTGSLCDNGSALNLTSVNPGGIWSGSGIVDSLTGEFNPSIVGQGGWNIFYAIGGNCGDTNSISITVNETEIASFNYDNSSYCIPIADPSPSISGTQGGVFSISNGGEINDSTGTIDLTSSGVGNYTITYETLGVCPDYSELEIEICENSNLIVPNIFTPNGDGKNDEFIVLSTNISELDAEVFNRWGKLIGSWSGVNGYWDGTSTSGSTAPEGTYFYIITATGNDGVEYLEKGHVSLRR